MRPRRRRFVSAPRRSAANVRARRVVATHEPHASASLAYDPGPRAAAGEIRAELGRGTWNLLHRMAAQYPERPTEDERMDMLLFIKLLSRLYACKECAGHFREMLERSPPELDSRTALVLWFCHRHNEVNQRLDKPEYTCDLDALEADYGDCGCEEEAEEGGGSDGVGMGSSDRSGGRDVGPPPGPAGAGSDAARARR